MVIFELSCIICKQSLAHILNCNCVCVAFGISFDFVVKDTHLEMSCILLLSVCVWRVGGNLVGNSGGVIDFMWYNSSLSSAEKPFLEVVLVILPSTKNSELIVSSSPRLSSGEPRCQSFGKNTLKIDCCIVTN